MNEAFRWPENKRCAVSLSFDDARPSQVDAGLPILNRHKVRATFYVIPRNIDQRREQWLQAIREGHEIGNHTINHPCSTNFSWSREKALEDYTLERIEGELLQANETIKQMLGVSPRTFAYPCGQIFVGRGRNHQSYVPVVAKHFEVGRHAFNEISNDPTLCDLALATSLDLDCRTFEQLLGLIEVARTEGRWLIFTGHDVREGPRQAVPPAVLDKMCSYCMDENNGIWIDTVAAIGAHVRKEQDRLSKLIRG